jgi:hypothetical protein
MSSDGSTPTPGFEGKRRTRLDRKANTTHWRGKSVSFIRARKPARAARAEAPAAWTLPRLLVLPGFLGIYLLVASRWPLDIWVAAAYLAASLAAFVAYAIDKSAARSGRWRTSEATLHSRRPALASGTPAHSMSAPSRTLSSSEPPN